MAPQYQSLVVGCNRTLEQSLLHTTWHKWLNSINSRLQKYALTSTLQNE